MTYNTCTTCGANNGRCGHTIGSLNHDRHECQNCYHTRDTGDVVIHADLERTDEELKRTFAILDEENS